MNRTESLLLARSPIRRDLLVGVLALAWLSGHAIAQDPDVVIQPLNGIPVQPDVVVPGPTPSVPQPPRAILFQESPHPALRVPVGPPNNIPQPNGPPTEVRLPDDPQIDTGQFKFFQNEIVKPSGANSSPRTPEPSTGMIQDTVLQTGNWQAALSPDNGQSWQNIDPYTFFPSVAGGFCCDQQVIHDPSRNIVIWLLQYSTDASGNNAYRFAVARSRDQLRSGNASDWVRYTFTPQSNFGYANNLWFDYPDIAIDSQWLYCRANVVGAGESVIWRMNLDDFAAGQGVSFQYVTSASILGWNHRLAKGSGQSRMGFAALLSTTQIYVYTWPTASGSGVTRSTRAIASWTDNSASAPGPDGRDWAGRWPNVGAIVGAYGNSTEMGFMWGCSPQSGRANGYTRVARFNLSDRTAIAEHDIWNATITFLYPDGMSSSLDHVGGVLACGSATRYVACANYVIDQYDAWPPNSVTLQSTGNSGPNQNRFGDYFTVRRHPLHPDTFISNGSSQNGGPNNAEAQHRFVWFGRDDYEPVWVNLSVESTGVAGVPITMDVTDLDNQKNGSTTFNRRFAPQQGYALTAPALHTAGSTTYAFERWQYRVQPGASLVSQPIGDRTLEITNIGNLDDNTYANYKLRRTITINSTNSSRGASITVSPVDINGNGNGTTPFSRDYRDGEPVTLTAPAAIGFNQFKRWVVGRTIYPNSTINLTVSANLTCTAEYWDNVAGKAVTIGVGCKGSNGVIPVQSITWPSGQQGPQQGTPTTYRLSSARPNTGIVLHIGLSKTTWNGFPLPLNLGFIGMTGCSLYHDLVISPNLTTNQAGANSFVVTLPVVPSAIGGSIYTTYAVIDIGANPLNLVHSNAMELVMGGNR